VTPALQRALDLGPARGALVQDISADMPGERAGIRLYDVIVSVDGQAVTSDDDLIRYISGRQPGTIATVELWRDGAARTLPVKLSERPIAETGSRNSRQNPLVRPAAATELGPLGIDVKALDTASIGPPAPATHDSGACSSRKSIPRVRRVSPGSAPASVLLEINRRKITSVADYRAAIASLRPNEAVAVLVYDQLSDQRLLATILPDPQS
jgi:serine protease Do